MFATASSAPQEVQPFDVSDYASLLEEHVDDRGRVDYAALRKDSAELDSFLTRLAALDPKELAKWKDTERIAFWVNAYNAFTLKAVVVHQPKKSIREIEGIWKQLKWKVVGEERTLDSIEHEILRRRFDEPRIHLGLVCASIGCPLLRDEPVTGAQLGRQLDEQAKLFFADATKFRIDRKAKKVHISPLFDWFGEDFVKSYGTKSGSTSHSAAWRAVLSFTGGHLAPEDARFLAGGEFEIELLEYDWGLNRQPAKRPGKER